MLPCYLFVYGTLQREFENRYARALRDGADFIGEARMRGRLFRIANYPGMTDGPGIVHGEVFRLRNSTGILKLLDRYERRDEYSRVRRKVHIFGRGPLLAWVYLYRLPITPDRRIRGGKYISLNRRKSR